MNIKRNLKVVYIFISVYVTLYFVEENLETIFQYISIFNFEPRLGQQDCVEGHTLYSLDSTLFVDVCIVISQILAL